MPQSCLEFLLGAAPKRLHAAMRDQGLGTFSAASKAAHAAKLEPRRIAALYNS